MLRDYDVKTFQRICDQVCATGGAKTDEAAGEQLLLDQRGLGGGRICGGSLWAQNGGEGEADLRCTSVGRPRKDIRADKSTGRVSDLLSMELFRMSMILLSVYDSSQLAPLGDE